MENETEIAVKEKLEIAVKKKLEIEAKIAQNNEKIAQSEAKIAQNNEKIAQSEAEIAKLEAKLKESSKRMRRMLTIPCGGLIAISVVVLQAFISAGKLDYSEMLSFICLATAIPMLSGCILYYSLYKDEKKAIFVLFGFGAGFAFCGVDLSLVHISTVAFVLFAVSAVVTAYLILFSVYGTKRIFKMFLRLPFLLFSSKYRQNFIKGETF